MATDTSNSPSTSPVPATIPEDAARNWDALVADENRTVTYEQIAEQAAEQGDAATAQWARERAAAKTEPEEPPAPKVDYSALKVDDLKKIAADRQIDTDELKTKSDLADALAAWDAAQPAPDATAAAAAALAAGA